MSTFGEHLKKGVEKVASQTQANLAVKPTAGGQGLGGDIGVSGQGLGLGQGLGQGLGLGLGSGGMLEEDPSNQSTPSSSTSLGTSGETTSGGTGGGGSLGGGAFLSGLRNAFINTNIGRWVGESIKWWIKPSNRQQRSYMGYLTPHTLLTHH